MQRYLVVANQTLGAETLANRLRELARHGPTSFHLVVPATPPRDHLWTEGEARATRGLRLFRSRAPARPGAEVRALFDQAGFRATRVLAEAEGPVDAAHQAEPAPIRGLVDLAEGESEGLPDEVWLRLRPEIVRVEEVVTRRASAERPAADSKERQVRIHRIVRVEVVSVNLPGDAERGNRVFQQCQGPQFALLSFPVETAE